jgi:hypothetical protein
MTIYSGDLVALFGALGALRGRAYRDTPLHRIEDGGQSP